MALGSCYPGTLLKTLLSPQKHDRHSIARFTGPPTVHAISFTSRNNFGSHSKCIIIFIIFHYHLSIYVSRAPQLPQSQLQVLRPLSVVPPPKKLWHITRCDDLSPMRRAGKEYQFGE